MGLQPVNQKNSSRITSLIIARSLLQASIAQYIQSFPRSVKITTVLVRDGALLDEDTTSVIYRMCTW